MTKFIGLSISENQDIKINLKIINNLLIKSNYQEALACLKLITDHNNCDKTEILIFLYKKLLINIDNIAVKFLIAEYSYFLEDYANALNELEEILLLDKEFSPAYVMLQKIYHLGYSQFQIVNLCNNLFQNKIYDTIILNILQEYYLEHNNFENNITLLELLIEQEPLNTQNYYNLAEIFVKNQEFEKAFAVYEQIFKMAPDSKNSVVNKCEEIIDKIPQNYVCRKKVIKLLFNICEPNKAIKHLEMLLNSQATDISEIIKIYKDGLLLYPDLPELLLGLSDLLISSNEFTESIYYLQIIFERLAIDPQILIARLKQIISKNPQQIYALLLLAEIYYKEQEYLLSLSVLEPAIDLDHLELDVIENKIKKINELNQEKEYCQFLLLKIRRIRKNDTNLIPQLDKIIQRNTLISFKAILLKILILEEKQKYEELIVFLHDRLLVYPTNNFLHQKLREVKNVVLKNKIENKIFEYEKGKNKTKRLNDLFDIGLLALHQGELNMAIQYLQQIIAEKPEDLTAQIFLARCFMELSRYDLSINYLRRIIIQIEDKNIPLANKMRYFLGLNYVLMGRFIKAIKVFEKILEFDLKFPQVNELLAFYKTNNFNLAKDIVIFSNIQGENILIVLENRQEKPNGANKSLYLTPAEKKQVLAIDALLTQNLAMAEDLLLQSLKMNAKNYKTYYYLTYLYLYKNDLENAGKYLDKLNSFKIASLDVLLLQANFFQKKQDDAKAINKYCQVIKADPNNPFVYLSLGDIYFKLGKILKAFTCWQIAGKNPKLQIFVDRRVCYLKNINFDQNCWLNNISIDLINQIKENAYKITNK